MTRLLLLALAAAGFLGAVLAVAGVHTPATGPLTLLFLLAEPALVIALLLPGLTPLARTITAGSMSLVVDGIVAQIMLSLDMWSPRRGVAGVAVSCLLLGLTALALARRPAGGAAPAARTEDEEWLFEG